MKQERMEIGGLKNRDALIFEASDDFFLEIVSSFFF